MIPRLALPPAPAVLALIALAFIAPGLAGHDLWKTFDAIGIEIAHQMHLSGDWVVPRVAGEPWLEDAPLYHWVALAFGKLLGWAIPFHNAARLASGLCARACALVPVPRVGRRGARCSSWARSACSCTRTRQSRTSPRWPRPAPPMRSCRARTSGRSRRARCSARRSGSRPSAGAGSRRPRSPPRCSSRTPLCAPWRSAKALPFLAAAAVAAALVAGSWPYLLCAARTGSARRLVVARDAHARRVLRQPALLRGNRQLVRLARVAARGLGAVGAAASLVRAAPVRARGGVRADFRRHRACRAGAGHHPHRAARAARAAWRARARPCCAAARPPRSTGSAS